MPKTLTRENVGYLFKFLLFANMCLYLEAGAIPAMLLQISDAFNMTSGHQGLLGGIPYLSLGCGSPIAGYLMRHYNTKYVLSHAIGINSVFTLIWAMTPVGQWYSLPMFISARFIMGLMQCIVCVFMPLWTNEFAPPSERTKWMGALQASVPFGVMSGYIIAAIMIGPSSGSDKCFSILCWRLPLLVEWMILMPFSIAVHFVPSSHLIMSNKGTKIYEKQKQLEDQSSYSRRRHSFAGPAVVSSSYGSIRRTETHGPRPSCSLVGPTALQQEEPGRDGGHNNGSGNGGECTLRTLGHDKEASEGAYMDDDDALGPPQQIRQESPDELLPPRTEKDSLLDRSNSTDDDPEVEHIKRKSWHAAQRKSMCASLYTAMSAREALMKSPSDGEVLAGLGLGYQSEENLLQHFDSHDSGDGTYDMETGVHSPMDHIPSPPLQDVRGAMEGEGIASTVLEFNESVPDRREGLFGGIHPDSHGSTAPHTAHGAHTSSCPADKTRSAVQYESLSKVQKEYFALLSPALSKSQALWRSETAGTSFGENDRQFKSRSAEITRHRAPEFLRRDLRYDDLLEESPQVETNRRRTWSRIAQRDSDTESESDAFAELFFSPQHRASLCDNTQPHVSSERTPWDWNGYCCPNRSSSLRAVAALLKISVYRNLLMALAALYFVVTGVQFWGTSYMLVALSAPRALVNTMFVFCAGTGPTMGVFFGGWLVDYMGGYVGSSQRVSVLKLCVLMGTLGCSFATLAVLVSSFFPFIVCLWLVLFCGASLLPACSGILVSVVPRKYRPVSSSLSIMTFNIFGYSLSLFFSGYLMEAIDIYVPACDIVCARKFGFRLVLLWSYWSLLFMTCALWSAIEHDKAVRKKRSKQRAMRILNSSLLAEHKK